ncbi:MAG: phosphatase PAP2 family protein [Roseburia sp.]
MKVGVNDTARARKSPVSGLFYYIRKIIAGIIIAFTIFMVVGRLISGVHWFTDFIGGALLSAGLVMLYYSISNYLRKSI